MRSGAITSGYIARHLSVITVECDRCGRSGKYRTDKLLAKYGNTDIQQFQKDITADCPRNVPTTELGKAARRSCRRCASFRAISRRISAATT